MTSALRDIGGETTLHAAWRVMDDVCPGARFQPISADILGLQDIRRSALRLGSHPFPI